MSRDHPFQIGQQYANRMGTYEVVAFDENNKKMRIRMNKDGLEIDTSIKIQSRIWRNMGWEDQEQIRKQADEDAHYQSGYGVEFEGLEASDFKRSTKGTTWRSRANLVGKVAQLLSHGTDYTFVSWAIYGWPVTFLTHRADYQMAAFDSGVSKSKFTIELDEKNVYYGFYVERGLGVLDHAWDWSRFIPAITSDEVEQHHILNLESQGKIKVVGRRYKGDATFHYADGDEKGCRQLWTENSGLTFQERLARINTVPNDEWVELYLVGSLPKQTAIDQGVPVANSIAGVMRELLPVYAAATGHTL